MRRREIPRQPSAVQEYLDRQSDERIAALWAYTQDPAFPEEGTEFWALCVELKHTARGMRDRLAKEIVRRWIAERS